MSNSNNIGWTCPFCGIADTPLARSRRIKDDGIESAVLVCRTCGSSVDCEDITDIFGKKSKLPRMKEPITREELASILRIMKTFTEKAAESVVANEDMELLKEGIDLSLSVIEGKRAIKEALEIKPKTNGRHIRMEE